MWPFPRTSSGPERPGLALSLADDGAAPALRASPSLAAPCRNPLRERYIAARFCGVARGAADLRSPDAVIKAARLYFEEERSDLAVELLAIAEEESGGEPAFVLARLEILYLAADRDEFVALARRFHASHPRHEAWPEVARLGQRLAPEEPLFGSAERSLPHDHYGPWPHLPNWIRAPWDLCAEVAAADFHRAVASIAAVGALGPDLTLDDGAHS